MLSIIGVVKDNAIFFGNFNEPIWIHKLKNYEYWPIWLFYIPISIYLFYFCMRARTMAFFTNVNPAMRHSGAMLYSKFDILQSIPEAIKPQGILVKSGEQIGALPPSLDFPLIAKPDMGERGKGVTIVNDMAQLKTYTASIDQDFILQSFCDYPQEAGIFYIRKPSESFGRVTSFTTKEFLSVTGDGINTIRTLMSLSYRAKMQIKRQRVDFLDQVPEEGEMVKIEAIGNHNRGTRFINSNHEITPELVSTFDSIAKNIDGFYYGRFDLKFKSLESLKKGEDIKIVELNGVNSEPTHLYDQRTGLINAYRDYFTNIKYMYAISVENKAKGIKRTNAILFWREIFFG